MAGTCTGYLIQADREPTPLPSLSQPELKRATGPASWGGTEAVPFWQTVTLQAQLLS
ncbi:hypothetical protein GCM10009601_49420 [Streptomyces thermospinosisporus]|uniref:Uncharacterized protein n=1 Tax=Streptomyces thermospinosisporus TaxID=161482 RepID=A0ABN1Z5F9_9ACTN